jgi:16S rRNA (adenine1518-N6/adenine1519-N6)-dimethyltransferase
MGQNFLSDPSTAEAIISRAHLSSEDVVLEIGAGLGALTTVLARVVKKVYAVEKDRQLIELLKTELLVNRISNCEIIVKNILQMDLHAITDTIGKKITVIGNLPYGISSQILIKLIQSRSAIERTVLMFQKEPCSDTAPTFGYLQTSRLRSFIRRPKWIPQLSRLGLNPRQCMVPTTKPCCLL